MSIVKSLAVGNGDMFYIRHNSDNFSVIDCCLPDGREKEILDEIETQSADKTIRRFISTHPDQDHISGLVDFDDRQEILNFYVVENGATKDDETEDFKRYKSLRTHSKNAFYLKRGCSRRWMNRRSEERDSAGINILWPILTNEHFKDALDHAEQGNSPNNISPIIRYNLANGASVMWMGDLETEFMEAIQDDVTLKASHILFAPHHGRRSGRVPKPWLDEIDPKIIVVGQAPSSDLTYYDGWDTITQNSAGDIVFECLSGKTHVFVSSSTYAVGFLTEESGVDDRHDCYYVGTFYT